MEKIFVLIPAYEDDLLIPTIEDCLKKAEHPERIVLGIGLQYKVLPEIPPHIPQNQLKILNYNVDNRPGLTRIMHDLCRLVTDEEYVMMINAHTNFYEKWDSLVIEDYNKLKNTSRNQKVILSSTSGHEVGPLDANSRVSCEFFFTQEDYLAISYKPSLIKTEKEFTREYTASTIFLFVDKSFVENDVFDGVSSVGNIEPILSFYCYILGWDIYRPQKINYVQHNGEGQWEIVPDGNGGHKTVPRKDLRYYDGLGRKIWERSNSSFYSLERNSVLWTHLLYAKNQGILKKNPKVVVRTPESFFKSIGLYNGYVERLKNNEKVMIEALSILFE